MVKLEDDLKGSIEVIQKDAKNAKNGTFSSLFNKGTFEREKFLERTSSQNKKISMAIADYFTKLYAMLNPNQQKQLIEKFEKIEHRKSR